MIKSVVCKDVDQSRLNQKKPHSSSSNSSPLVLATFLVFGIGIHRSAGCPKSAQAQRIKEVLFGLKIKRAGSSFFSEKVSATKQNND
jgi:hypothetical protein